MWIFAKKVLGIRVGWKGGHAWTFDGLIASKKDGQIKYLIHCNWGWNGCKNGYYLSKVFDTNAGAKIYDTKDSQLGNTSNYKYNIKYSLIER